MLLFLQKMKNIDYDGRVKFEPSDIDASSSSDHPVTDEFEKRLISTVGEMRQSSFERKPDIYNICNYCPYTIFCGVHPE